MDLPILVVDDETSFLSSVERALRMHHFEDVRLFADPREALDALNDTDFAAALLDVAMPGMDGLELLTAVKEKRPRTECIMVTADESVGSIVRAMKLGAFDYLVKPVTPDKMVAALERALEHRRLLDIVALRGQACRDEALDRPDAFAEVLTADQALIRTLHEAELHAASSIPILLTGETGTGKELLARAIHTASGRAKGPFVAVNMLSLSPTLFESEFFGHVKGSFTGANRDHAGYLAQGAGGTLFLDEIGDLPMEIQGKLLRILQEGEYTPVGGTSPRQADVRFVAATNQDLEERIEEGSFRRDLYYRLRFAHLDLPPLRERPDDIHLLAQAFIRASARPDAGLSDQAAALLHRHDWPGNVRELKGVIEAAANLAEGGEILPAHLNLPESGAGAPPAQEGEGELLPLAEVERRHILHVYHALDDNKTHASRALGVSLATLQRKLKAYGVP